MTNENNPGRLQNADPEAGRWEDTKNTEIAWENEKLRAELETAKDFGEGSHRLVLHLQRELAAANQRAEVADTNWTTYAENLMNQRDAARKDLKELIEAAQALLEDLDTAEAEGELIDALRAALEKFGRRG